MVESNYTLTVSFMQAVRRGWILEAETVGRGSGKGWKFMACIGRFTGGAGSKGGMNFS